MDFSVLILILSGLFVGWTIGANDAANCLGPSVGAGFLSMRWATLLVAIFALLGAVIEGGPTLHTLGEGIIDTAGFSTIDLSVALVSAALIITTLTFLSVPISSTQAVLGAIVGLGLIVHTSVDWRHISLIFILGFITPLAAFLITYLFHRFVLPFILERETFLSQERVIRFFVVGSGLFLAFSLGANNIGNAVGIIIGKGAMVPLMGAILGGMAIGLGSATLGKRVMHTVAKKITHMDPTMALSAQLGASFVVHVLTRSGIPTSFTFAMIGAIAGVGVVKGHSAVDRHTLFTVISAWVITPMVSIILTMAMYGFVHVVMGNL